MYKVFVTYQVCLEVVYERTHRSSVVQSVGGKEKQMKEFTLYVGFGQTA